MNILKRWSIKARPAREYYEPARGFELEPYLAAEDLNGIHHLARYHWAKAVLRALAPAKILDIACGAGYGAYLLADCLPQAQVTGADYDARAIARARAAHRRPNLNFCVGDLATWTTTAEPRTALGRYDAVVCFDTLEHVLHRDLALIRITQNLNDHGALLLSTPNIHAHTVLNPDWAAHRIEYSAADLQYLLKRFFRTVRLPEDGSLPHLSFWTDVVNKGKLRYPNVSNPVVCLDPLRI